jgi:bisphosphoglycerate-independent phosphoglycerate mutase (AlkP superfamily)
MRGVLDCWDDSEGLIIITSDHGNLENVGDRHHTENDVPTVIIGAGKDEFAEGLTDLTGFIPRMARLLFES